MSTEALAILEDLTFMRPLGYVLVVSLAVLVICFVALQRAGRGK